MHGDDEKSQSTLTTTKPSAYGLATKLRHRTSLPAEVADLIRSLIVSGKLASGERVIETRIARELGVGQATVREALATLAGEGLVQHRPNRGYCVSQLTVEEIDQIFLLREEWEVLAVRLALERRQLWSGRCGALLEAVKGLHRAAANKDVVAYFSHDDLAFHKALWELSGNNFLVQALTRITIPVFAFCMILRVKHLEIDLEENACLHEVIAEALLSEGPESALKITQDSIRSFRRLTQDLLRQS